MIDPETGDIINSFSGSKVFSFRDLDEKGNIPMPYSIEKFNFNPFEMLGTFFYDDLDDPLSFQQSTKQGKHYDELGRLVSVQGFMLDQSNNMIDKNGIPRFAAQ